MWFPLIFVLAQPEETTIFTTWHQTRDDTLKVINIYRKSQWELHTGDSICDCYKKYYKAKWRIYVSVT